MTNLIFCVLSNSQEATHTQLQSSGFLIAETVSDIRAEDAHQILRLDSRPGRHCFPESRVRNAMIGAGLLLVPKLPVVRNERILRAQVRRWNTTWRVVEKGFSSTSYSTEKLTI